MYTCECMPIYVYVHMCIYIYMYIHIYFTCLYSCIYWIMNWQHTQDLCLTCTSRASLNLDSSHVIWHMCHVNHHAPWLVQVDRKKPPPRGGILFTMVPEQEPCVRDFTTWCDRCLKISYTRLLIREHRNQKPPSGEGGSLDLSEIYKWHMTSNHMWRVMIQRFMNRTSET